jgi:hypothetical protein
MQKSSCLPWPTPVLLTPSTLLQPWHLNFSFFINLRSFLFRGFFLSVSTCLQRHQVSFRGSAKKEICYFTRKNFLALIAHHRIKDETGAKSADEVRHQLGFFCVNYVCFVNSIFLHSFISQPSHNCFNFQVM